ncbi:hypothetical protein, partial [Enterococcus sp.]|uniref:hypothetical protein n=1 Tax=Enterococcus sp. TaxID=35783 RepID=UPI0029091962
LHLLCDKLSLSFSIRTPPIFDGDAVGKPTSVYQFWEVFLIPRWKLFGTTSRAGGFQTYNKNRLQQKDGVCHS